MSADRTLQLTSGATVVVLYDSEEPEKSAPYPLSLVRSRGDGA